MNPFDKWNALPDNPGWQTVLQTKPTKKATKKKPWYSALISEGGATGGAIGGAALGSAIFPGVGTLAGALIGGAAGGFGGSAAEQKIRDNKINLKKAGLEAAISGVLMPGPLKLAKAGGTAIKAGVGGRPVAEAVNQAITRRGAITTPKTGGVAERLESRAGGFGVGEKAAGGRPEGLGLKGQKRIFDTLSSEKIPPGHPETRLSAIQARMADYGGQMDEVLKTVNRPLSQSQRNAIATDYLKIVKSKISSDPSVLKYATSYAATIRNSKNLGTLVGHKRDLQSNLISWTRNPQSAVPGQDRAAKLAQDVLNKHIGKLSPELKGVNKRYSDLANAAQYVTGRAGRLTRASESQHTTLSGQIRAGDLGTTVQSRAGSALRNLPGGKAITASTPGARSPVGYGTRAVIGSGLAQSIIPGQEQPIDSGLEAPADETTLPPELGMDPMGGMEQPQSQYPLEQALADIQRDPKHANTYMSIYKMVEGANKTSQLSAAQRKGLTSAGNVEIQLNQLEKMISPELFPKTNQTAASIGGLYQKTVGRYTDTDKKLYMDSLRSRGIQVVRAFGEVGNLTQQEQDAAIANLPSPGDTYSGARRKIKMLRELFGQVKQNVYNSGGANSGNDLTEALMQMQGDY